MTEIEVNLELLAGYPVIHHQVVEWAEMDPFQHVNNIVYFRWMENCRIAYLERVGWWQLVKQIGVGPILGSIQARFRRPVEYPDTVAVGAKITDVGVDRVTMEHRIISTARGEVVTEGTSVIVCYDYNMKQKAPIPDEVRKRIAELQRET